MLFLFYVTQMAQISQIILARGNIYVTQKFTEITEIFASLPERSPCRRHFP